MANRKLEGFPTFSGNVTRMKVESHITPTFDESFDVQVRKVQSGDVPSIGDEKPQVITVKPKNPTFGQKLKPKIYKVKRG
jgi:hypothetical protein